MEIVQTGTGIWPWRMGMFGARFAVFVRRARVLPSHCPATRNYHLLFQLVGVVRITSTWFRGCGNNTGSNKYKETLGIKDVENSFR